jgi:Protein of unknown function (DUF2794)
VALPYPFDRADVNHAKSRAAPAAHRFGAGPAELNGENCGSHRRMTDDLQPRPMATVLRLHDHRRRARAVFFSRFELNQLLALYSRQVARGEWRDYAIDQRDGAAHFAVFRHTQECALYTVVKTAPGAQRPGDFTLLSGRQRLAGGKTLGEVLALLRASLRGRAVLLDESRR